MWHAKRISLIIPTLNEERNLPLVLRSIPKYVDEVVVVDGHSRDDTVKVAKAFGCKVYYDRVGKGSALMEGARHSKGDFLVMMDADCSNSATELRLLIDGLEEGYDVCMGSRFMKGGGSGDITLLRKLGNKFFVSLVNLLFASHYTDLCYGYRSLRREALAQLDLKSKGFSIETEMSIKVAKKKMRVLEVPSFEKKRGFGSSRLRTFSDGWKIFNIILKEGLGK